MKISPDLCRDVLAFLDNPSEKANEHLLLRYFQTMFPDRFSRQKDAKHSDGWVPGRFVLEIKTDSNDWLAGLCQGIAYSREIDFSLVIVAAGGFLSVWHMRSVPADIVSYVVTQDGPANEIGKLSARKFKSRLREVLNTSVWQLILPVGGTDRDKRKTLTTSLEELSDFLVSQDEMRIKIRLKDFEGVIRHLIPFFDKSKPASPVRAFYAILPNWFPPNLLQIDGQYATRASYAGVVLDDLIPGKRQQLKILLDKYELFLGEKQSCDDFYSKFDVALNAVAPEFRDVHGVYFTNPDLAKFAVWWSSDKIDNLGKDYLVIDPACGSGNLIASWSAPLKMRHKVMSDFDPECVHAVEERMIRDRAHEGRYTILSESASQKGLNFLAISAAKYLEKLTESLADRKIPADKPIAFLCNPPYRNDDDRATGENIRYDVDESIKEITGTDLASERYCCFIAQMLRICEQATDIGFPGNSVLLLFTQTSWLTNRPVYRNFKKKFLSNFVCMGGFMVTAKEFFDDTGKWPLAFTAWSYNPALASKHETQDIKLLDLTDMKKQHLDIDWENPEKAAEFCKNIITAPGLGTVDLGILRTRMHDWAAVKTVDFKRDRTKTELPGTPAGGLPIGDNRVVNKKTYGRALGAHVGFMGDLTPVRVGRNPCEGRPWFRLNSLFMDCRKTRCFSAPPDQKGFSAPDDERMKKLFLWYAFSKTCAVRGYPLWANTLEMWAVDADNILPEVFDELILLASAIVYATNESVSLEFPENNPVVGGVVIRLNNPMSPLEKDSFWSKWNQTYLLRDEDFSGKSLIRSVDQVFLEWNKIIGGKAEYHVPFQAKYFLGQPCLYKDSGLVQILAFARESGDKQLSAAFDEMQIQLSNSFDLMYHLMNDEKKLNYYNKEVLNPIEYSEADSRKKTKQPIKMTSRPYGKKDTRKSKAAKKPTRNDSKRSGFKKK